MRPPYSGSSFPEAEFVHRALEAHLAEFEHEAGAGEDLVWFNEDSGVRWVVEVKGGKGLARFAFQAGLSRLLTRMDAGSRAIYCLALPDTKEYSSLCGEIPSHVRVALNLWWFLIGEDGTVDAVLPMDPVR